MFILKVSLIVIIMASYIFLSVLSIKQKTLYEISLKNKISCDFKGRLDALLISWKRPLVILQSLPVLGCIYMIMDFSSDNGNASRLLSRPVAYIISRLIGFFSPSPKSDIHVASLDELMALQSLYLDMIEKITRKCAHMAEYGVFALVIWVLIYCRKKIPGKYAYLGGFLGVLILGSIDEFNQSSIEGRWGSPVDVGVDLMGAFLSMLLVTLIMKHVYKKCRKNLL